MAATFDPSLPANNSLIVSQELRDQFNSLNDQDTGLEALIHDRAFKPLGVTPMPLGVSDPPSQAEVQALQDKINELIAALNS